VHAPGGFLTAFDSNNRKRDLAGKKFTKQLFNCEMSEIVPAHGLEGAVDSFVSYRSRCGKPADAAFRRLMARAWNANVGTIPGWPATQLVVPSAKPLVDIEWGLFPLGLRQDVDRYLERLTRIRRSRTGQRIRPLKPSTIRTRRAELQAAARIAVKNGVPINTLNGSHAS
jgi:hypothetical protein